MELMAERLLKTEQAGTPKPEKLDRSLEERPGNPRIYCNPRVFADNTVANFNEESSKPRGRWLQLLGYLGINKPFVHRQND